MEWELALGVEQGSGLDRNQAFLLLREALCQLSPWLPDRENERGIYTPGFRFYLDTGEHPEVGSFEVSAPEEMLKLKAGLFHLLGQALERARIKIPGLVLFAANHAYGAERDNSWGNHENYAIRMPAESLSRGMIPFLATRMIFAGSGRLDPCGRLLFSPRACTLHRAVGGSTVSNRALFSTSRNEPLMRSGPFTNRLHLINGDAVRSDMSEYLKVATTALVLLWLQEDPSAADDLNVRSPMRLVRAANCCWRPPWQVRVCPAALRLQQAYCDRVERFVESKPDLPGWCGEAVERWKKALAFLRDDPLALIDRIDPFIKLGLFEAALSERGRQWSDIARDRRLYEELALLDLAYHRLGPDSLFSRLEVRSPYARNGAGDLATTMQHVPTRASVRALLVSQHSGQTNVRCSWSGLERRAEGQWLDLGDPTITVAPEWGPQPKPVAELLRQVLRLYDRGYYEKAGRLLQDVAAAHSLAAADLQEYLVYHAWVQTRRGRLEGLQALNEVARLRPLDFRLVTDYVYVLRFQGLRPAPEIVPWIERGRQFLERDGQHQGATALAFLSHVAAYHLRHEEPAQAVHVFEKALAFRAQAHLRVLARLLADLGDTQRRLGRRERAEKFLAEAEGLQQLHGFEGDLAEFTLPYQARLATAPNQALELLERSLASLRQHGNRVGETRTLLVQARLTSDPALKATCRAKVEENRAALPTLAKCALLSEILQNWDVWIGGGVLREGGDYFWGL